MPTIFSIPPKLVAFIINRFNRQSLSTNFHHGWRSYHGHRRYWACRSPNHVEIICHVCLCSLRWCLFWFRFRIYQRSACHGLLYSLVHRPTHSRTKCHNCGNKCICHPNAAQIPHCFYLVGRHVLWCHYCWWPCRLVWQEDYRHSRLYCLRHWLYPPDCIHWAGSLGSWSPHRWFRCRICVSNHHSLHV